MIKKHNYFQKKKIDPDGRISYHNKKNLNNQKMVTGYLLRKIGSNLLQGKSIMSISMPIDIFDTTSFLERLAYSYTHAPTFLEKAAKEDDPKEAIKYVSLPLNLFIELIQTITKNSVE